jgi:uncharacterized protein YdeI (YjbR/CyaY-like superfamily)
VQVEHRAEWRSWLAANHTRAESIWLVTFKKAAGERYLPYEDVVEEALCFGWIDSLGRTLDHERKMLLLSPRKAGSGWSKVNKERIERLIAQGLMMAPGFAKIEQAKADGSWSRLDQVEALIIPDDLAQALARQEGATTNFEAFPRSAKRGILGWILQAKRPETRAKRVEETALLAAENRRANNYRDR